MNIAKWKKMPKERIEEIVKESYSNREVARKLGYAQNGGGTMQSIRTMYKELNIDTSHFKGQGWNKDNHDYESFTEYSYKKNGKNTRDVLVSLRGEQCECCGLETWLDKPINLEVHHKNGDRTDNRLENLQLLCPNCHSYTPTFRRSRQKRYKTDDEFVQALQGSQSIREALRFLDLSDNGDNYSRAWHLISQYDIEHLKNKKEK